MKRALIVAGAAALIGLVFASGDALGRAQAPTKVRTVASPTPYPSASPSPVSELPYPAPIPNSVRDYCGPPSYGADGNMAPVLCEVPNPIAVKYFRQALGPLLKLGPDANPIAIHDQVCKLPGGTLPITTSAYTLAYVIEGWGRISSGSYDLSPQAVGIGLGQAGYCPA